MSSLSLSMSQMASYSLNSALLLATERWWFTTKSVIYAAKIVHNIHFTDDIDIIAKRVRSATMRHFINRVKRCQMG